RRLAPLRKTHPHVVERAQRGNFGIALYSRLPILSSRIAKFSDPDLPSIVATLKLDARRSVRVIATHPVPPLHSRESAKLRDAHINKLADLASATRHLPLVVAGDLNATQFSPIFAKLLSRGRLRSARQGHGVLPSWPTSLWPMRIPLDHVLVNHRLRTLRVALGPDIGSDHLPLIARLGLTPEGELDN
ncbi:MAG: endonuclease/exonuclease/phosphatase family protein, partial [Myxococcales bacterium]|nr:endonuclease/exonuclease/phosphatase family protein [Myxococcales bacterium]